MSNDIIAQLKELKLHGMASGWPELLAQSRHTEFEPERFMKQLLLAETAERQVRSIAYQMTAARFPAHRDLKGFDFASARVDEALIRELNELAFLESAHNVVFIGRPGVGKTTTVVCCLMAAFKRGERCIYYLFDETLGMLLARSKSLGMDLSAYLGSGLLTLRQIDPAEMSPGQFTSDVREAVEEKGVTYVAIDSLNAYLRRCPASATCCCKCTSCSAISTSAAL